MTYPWTLNYSNWKQIIQFTAIMMIKIFRAVILYSSFFLAKKKTKLTWCCCSVTRSCLTLCNPMDCNTPGFPVLQHLPEFAQTHIHWFGDYIQSSHPLLSLSPPAFNLSQHRSFPVSQLFASNGKSIGASASESVFPMNIQGWLPLWLTGLICLQSKGLSRVFSITTVWKNPFFSI